MSAQTAPSAHVMTVQGAVEPSELGFTLMHEHLVTRFWHASHRYDLACMPEDRRYVLDELARLISAGCRTLVDVTPVGINRDPLALREIAEQAGIQIVMGCGWYRDSYFPAKSEIDRRPVGSLADEMLAEIEDGVAGSGVRPGIVGEIGTEKDWMSPAEERVHRAAGRAAAASGLALMTHSFASDVGLWQLQVLCEEGVAPSKVIIGHADTYRLKPYHLALLRAGANIEFDTMLWYRRELFENALDLLHEYVQEGFLDQLLISMDTCKAEHLTLFGGAGMTAVHDRVIPGLLDRGLTETDVAAIFMDNPRRILTVDTKVPA